MELVPKTLREVEFREKLRGYNQDDVDDFLEQVAVGLEALQDQLRQANERGGRGDGGRGLLSDDDDPIRRTLVLAQRTADMAIKEAREQADQIVAAAEARAQTTLSQADEEAALRRQSGESALRAEVERLAKARETLIADVAALEEHLERARGDVKSNLDEALHWLEDHLHGAPDRPELRTDPGVVDQATAGPETSSEEEKRASEPEGSDPGDDWAAPNGSVSSPLADDRLAPRPAAEDEPDLAGEPTRPGWPGAGTRAPDHQEDPRPDPAGSDETEVLPTIGPGRPPSGLFDADQLD